MLEVVGYRVEDNYDIDNSILSAAKKLFKDGKYSDAIKLYSNLLKTSANSKIYFDIGICYYKKNDYDNAIEALKNSVNLDISNAKAYSYLGNCYFKKLDTQNAIENWSKSRSINPIDEFVCLNLAIAYYVKNKNWESMYFYNKFIKYAQNKNTAQYKSIEKNLKEALQISNEYYTQANQNRLQNAGSAAENNYIKAIKKYPIASEYSLGLANLYYDTKSYSLAITYYKNTLRDNNISHKDIYKKLAECYQNQSDYRMAYCFYKRYLQHTISSQNDYLNTVKQISDLKKLLNSSVQEETLEMAKKYYDNNEYFDSLMEYQNCLILNSQEVEYIEEKINILKGYTNSEEVITQKYLSKGKELLNEGKQQGANKYFTQVIHLSEPKSIAYKLAKSKLVNV